MEDFAKDYDSLKKDYMMALSTAIRGKNPEDIQKVLNINTQIGSRIRDFLKILADKKEDVDYTTIEQLKTDLIETNLTDFSNLENFNFKFNYYYYSQDEHFYNERVTFIREKNRKYNMISK
jgi:hypothetical protein